MEFSYQPGDFSVDLEELLLLRRLKSLGKFWSRTPEEIDDTEWKNNDLVLHLASSAFISHASLGVKLLTAYNIAQVLRIRQCNHPFEKEALRKVFLFLINQLQMVSHERIDVYKYQEKILEILLMKGVIELFCDMRNLEQAIVHLFSSVLNAAHPDLTLTSKERIITLIGTLVEHAPNLPQEMIQMIFVNCQNKKKLSNRIVYDMTMEFIRKYPHSLGTAIGKVMFRELSMASECDQLEEGESASTLDKMKHWMARLWKLHSICNDLTIPILKNLECALYTMPHKCRCILILFLGKLFSQPSNVDLHEVCSSLWKGFLGRFQDKKLDIRLFCLDQVADLFKREGLRADLISALGKRKMDRVSKVRKNLTSLVFILLKESLHFTEEVISDLSRLLEALTKDPEVNVRFLALRCMAELYDFFTENGRNYFPILKEVGKYPKCILEHYWVYEKHFSQERLIVIQLLNRYIVPYTMPPDERMKRLLKVLATLDFQSCSTLAKIKYQRHTNCKHLMDVIKFAKESRAGVYNRKKIAMLNAMAFCRHIPLPLQAALSAVIALSRKLSEDKPEVESINNALACKSLDGINQVLEYFKANKKYTDEFTWIFELASDWLFDEQSFKIFVSYIDDILMERTNLLEELQINEIPIENVFSLLEVSSATFLSGFYDYQLVSRYISWFRIFQGRNVKLHVLKILTMLQSEDKELLVKYPDVMNELILICQESCSKSDTEIAKWCIRCLMIAESKREELTHYLLSMVQDLALDMTSSDLLRAYCSIYYLGYISLYMGSYFKDTIPDVLNEQVINNIVLREDSSSETSSISLTHPRIHMKIKARYLKFLGQCAFEGGSISYKNVFKFLFGVIENGGVFPASSTQSADENIWMRLAAGRAVLRVLRGGTMNMLTCRQFYLLSNLMSDTAPEVRDLFSKKLRISLHCDYPKITMPPELLSLFVLAKFEDSDFDDGEESNVTTTLRHLFSMKLNFIKLHFETEAFSEFGNNVNEVLVYGMLILSHSDTITNLQSLEQLLKCKAKLKVLLDFLISSKDVNIGFYKKQTEMAKNHMLKGEDEDSNKKFWTICDIVLLLLARLSTDASKERREPTLPKRFFEPKPIKNSRIYLTRKVIAALFAKGDQRDRRASKRDDEEEVSEYESDETEGEMDNLVVMVGEGNMTAEDEWDFDDEMFGQTNDAELDGESLPLRRSSRKRKRSGI